MDDVKFKLRKLVDFFFMKKLKPSYKSNDKLKLIQTICFSMQLDEILFSFLRELIQEENLEELQEIIKPIFKLLKCLIYKSKNFQEKIQINFLSFKNLESLYNLGYLSLVCEEIKVNYKFAIENSDFILELIKSRFQAHLLEAHLKAYENVMNNTSISWLKKGVKPTTSTSGYYKKKQNNNKNNSEDKENFYSDFKELNKILMIMNNFLNTATDEKYQKILLEIFTNLIKDIQHKKFFDIECKSRKTEIRKFELVHFKIKGHIIRIAYSFIKNNEKLKTVIKKLLPKEYIEEKILFSKWHLKVIRSSTSKKDIDLDKEKTNVEDLLQNTLVEHELNSIKQQIRLKFYGCKLFNSAYEFQRTKDLGFIQSKHFI